MTKEGGPTLIVDNTISEAEEPDKLIRKKEKVRQTLVFISLLDSVTVGSHSVTIPSAATAGATFTTMPVP